MAVPRSTLMIGLLYALVLGGVAWLVWPTADNTLSPQEHSVIAAMNSPTSGAPADSAGAVGATDAAGALPSGSRPSGAGLAVVPAPAAGPVPAALSTAERERVLAAFHAAADQDVQRVSDALAAARAGGAPAEQVAALEARLATMKQTMGDVAARHPAP